MYTCTCTLQIHRQIKQPNVFNMLNNFNKRFTFYSCLHVYLGTLLLLLVVHNNDALALMILAM